MPNNSCNIVILGQQTLFLVAMVTQVKTECLVELWNLLSQIYPLSTPVASARVGTKFIYNVYII